MMKIVTLNMRTSQHSKRIPELRAVAQEQYIDVFSIQEHQLCYEETAAEVDYIDVSNNWMFACSCTEKNATFSGNPQVTIICCYSLTNANSEEIKQEFYDSLATVTKNVSTHNVTIVAGDRNTKLSLEHSV